MKSSLADASEQLERREFDTDAARGVTLPFESPLNSELSSGRGVLIAVFVMASCFDCIVTRGVCIGDPCITVRATEVNHSKEAMLRS